MKRKSSVGLYKKSRTVVDVAYAVRPTAQLDSKTGWAELPSIVGEASSHQKQRRHYLTGNVIGETTDGGPMSVSNAPHSYVPFAEMYIK